MDPISAPPSPDAPAGGPRPHRASAPLGRRRSPEIAGRGLRLQSLLTSALVHAAAGAGLVFVSLVPGRRGGGEDAASLLIARAEEDPFFEQPLEPPPEIEDLEELEEPPEEVWPEELAFADEEDLLPDPVIVDVPLEHTLNPRDFPIEPVRPPAPPAVAVAPPAPPPPPATVPELTDPVLLESPPPPYPPLAHRRGWEGTVVCRIAVAPDGTALAVEIERSSGHRILDEAAREALLAWRFVPARRGGEPCAGEVRHQITFQILAD
ncbi:MAG: energy transducer TonB [Planctomycetota bacterium]